MKKVEILAEVVQGNIVINGDTLYRNNDIFTKVDNEAFVKELLDEYLENPAAFEANSFIIFDLYGCYIMKDDFEEYQELEIDFVAPDGDYADKYVFFYHDNKWYRKER